MKLFKALYNAAVSSTDAAYIFKLVQSFVLLKMTKDGPRDAKDGDLRWPNRNPKARLFKIYPEALKALQGP